jgi:hypothetical protein
MMVIILTRIYPTSLNFLSPDPSKFIRTEASRRKPRSGRKKGSGEIEFEFVDEAPAPGFAGFEGLHDGVLGGMKMFGGVLVFGGIAAADVAALEAQAEVDPGVSHFQALFAAAGVGLDGANLRKVRAVRHGRASIKD